jgi:hypothetical protein
MAGKKHHRRESRTVPRQGPGLDSTKTNSVSGIGGGYKAEKFRFLLFL